MTLTVSAGLASGAALRLGAGAGVGGGVAGAARTAWGVSCAVLGDVEGAVVGAWDSGFPRNNTQAMTSTKREATGRTHRGGPEGWGEAGFTALE